MKYMLKKTVIFLSIFILCLPALCRAREEISQAGDDQVIEAEILEIMGERELEREDGSKNIQQDIKLKGLSGDWKDKIFTFQGISDLDVVSGNEYQKGDKVLVDYSKDIDGKDVFYIVDYMRRDNIYLLSIIFVLTVIFIAGFKGARALLSLMVSFGIIMGFIIPRILAGSNPLFITILGSLMILIFVIYFTEGFNRRSHLAILSILLSLFITGILASLFSGFAKLSGMVSEEAMFLIGASKMPINFWGLLLAGIIIGTLGVLDDVVISQLATIEEIKEANPSLNNREVYKKSFSVGVSHISSMTNTLFLAYAGASLPLLLLFSVKQPPFVTFSQVINNQSIATEIVRTLVGSIGLVLVVPIATFLGVKFYKARE